MDKSPRRSQNLKLGLLAFLWLATMASALFFVLQKNADGQIPQQSPKEWPTQTALHKSQGFDLIFILHPGCECSAASLSELERVLKSTSAKVKVHALFTVDENLTLNPYESNLWIKAQALGLNPRIDKKGVEAALFQAQTSGTVLLYNSANKLVFSGGITASRGHEGPNAAADALLEQLNTAAQNSTLLSSVVFGCHVNGEN